jgi:tape measure domain-containing protein
VADSVKIRISGDDSSYRKTLGGLGSVTASALKGVAVATTAVSAAWSAIGTVGVQYNASIEQLQTSFEVMTGSAEQAADVLARIRKLGASTPFETEGLAETTQLLMNYGFTADNAIDSMMRLGDISQGNQDKLTRIATAYGQMSSAGKVSLEDVKQMIEAGFNPLQEISQSTGESMASLYDRISKGKLSIDEITASMERSTSAGGKYFKSMEKQSQTLNGQLSTLKDNAMTLLGNVMEPISEQLSASIIPMANAWLGDFAMAFQQSGMDGLLNAVTDKIPDLLDMVMSAADTMLSKVMKWLPSAIKQLASMIPNALRAILNLSPQIVTALFDIVSSLVGDLIVMLPELVPMILDGLGMMLDSVMKGFGTLLENVFDSVDDMLIKLGWKKAGLEKQVGNLFNTYDKANVQNLKADWNVDVSTSITVDDYQTKINEAIANIKSALANIPGLTSTEAAAIQLAIANGTGIQLLQDALKKYGVDPQLAEQVTQQIMAAQGQINGALEELGLSEDAKKKIWEVAQNGGDVTQALIDCGVPPGQAELTAGTITGGMAQINAALSLLGLDPQILSQVLSGAGDDKAMIIAILELLKAPPETIAAVAASYDTVSGTLSGKLTAAINSAYAALTDGETDTPKVMSDIKSEIEQAYQDAVDEINKWIDDQIAKLDPTSSDYEEKVQGIRDIGKENIDQVTAYQEAMWAIVAALANKGVDDVDAAWVKVLDLLGKTKEIVAQYDLLKEELATQNEADVALTKAGGVRKSTQDVGRRAISYTQQKYALDTQTLEDEFQTKSDELAQKFKEDNDMDAYNKALDDLETEYAQKNADRLDAYRTEMSDLVQGLIKSVGATDPELAAALQEKIKALNVQDEIKKLWQPGTGSGENGKVIAEDISQDLLDTYAEAFGEEITPEALAEKINTLRGNTTPEGSKQSLNLFNGLLSSVQTAAETEITGENLGFVSDLLETAVEEGAFTDFSTDGVDISTPFDAMKALGTRVAKGTPEGMRAVEPDVTAAGQEVVDTAATSTDGYDEMSTSGDNSAQGWIDAYGKRVDEMETLSYNSAVRIHKAFKRGQLESSPSKAFMLSGKHAGEGYEIGFNKSMDDAIRSVRRSTASLIDAATIRPTPIVQRVEISQEAAAAMTPTLTMPDVYLDGRLISTIQGRNNSLALGQLSKRQTMAVGG